MMSAGNIYGYRSESVLCFCRMCRKRTFRKFTKIRTVFPTDESLFKSLYLAQDKITSKWNVPYGNWGIIYSSLQIIFEGRV